MLQKSVCWLATIAIFTSSCHTGGKPSSTQDTAIPVITQTVQTSTASHAINISGNIEGSKTVHLGFMVAGKINYIAADEGQTIRSGQLLASLDPQNYAIAKEMADASTNQAQDEYNRLKIMYDRKSISESDYSKITNTLAQARAQQKLQAKNLSDTKLYSPISGVLLKKSAETGEITSAGMPLFTVSDIRTVKVNAYIPESELNNVKLGQEAAVLVGAVNDTFHGKVTEVGAAADAAARAFTVKITLDNPQLLIRPGMIAEIKLASGNVSNILAIPVEAVMHDIDGQTYVYVVDTQRHQAFKRKVSIGQLSGNLMEITTGLNTGEQIVTGGQQKLNDGAVVSLSK
ncbi:efflux RND transporter periplasmic adaptor subunit [Chitinophaga silvisoli]|uniref:Efflux RND transporter periplasmic adaptor subunit n=1 Tax=Chitinophaga silvisoli TaxID=2291814 RepID=A0A3E1NWF2_9BACT|nr:efflux RND transporter periplasmic adaptor subunit [Chitinophaga silvisoli]RFM32249.1 efflux RND transporter periplasmic adaptor subunit [Chitinophaga silvisoli]